MTPIIKWGKHFSLVDKLKSNNLHQETNYSHAEAKFIGQSDYGRIIEQTGVQVRSENGFDINAYIENARKGYIRAKEKKQVATSPP